MFGLAASTVALAGETPKKPLTFGASPELARGKYLVAVMGCNDCHTPMKMGAKGPEPDFAPHVDRTSSLSDVLEATRTALRALRANLFRAILTLLGIVIGVASVIAMLAIGDGAKQKVIDQVSALGTNLLTVRPGAPNTRGRDAPATLVIEDVQAIAGLANVLASVPEQGATITLRAGNLDHRSSVNGTSADYVVARNWAPASGTFFSAEDEARYATVAVLAQGMLDLGLIDRNKHGTAQDVIDSRAYFQFYMHRTGHWLGMDVHDCGSYVEPSEIGQVSERKDPLSGELIKDRPSRILRPGMVLTIEPGLYVRPSDKIPKEFWNIGIRIEDDAVVTETGCELITRDVPVAPDAIEALMR